ncbi:P-loop containing nucleoside triphosphate hydrolase protein, partial [Pavlovales sp. CCMP2436]
MNREASPSGAYAEARAGPELKEYIVMEEELYDEFGNYIGPELRDDDDEGAVEEEEEDEDEYADDNAFPRGGEVGAGAMETDDGAAGGEADGAGRVVLHEDKRYYPTLGEVYGEEVETRVEEEDSQPITQPIVAPAAKHEFDLSEPPGATSYSPAFLASLLGCPGLVRNVAVVGALGHGKTALLDLLIEHTHPEMRAKGEAEGSAPKVEGAGDEARRRTQASLRAHDPGRVWLERRYLDARKDEQARGLSIKANPISLVLATSRAKSFALNLIDAPGHVCFADEGAAALRLADGVALCVDCVEGLLMPAERMVRQAVSEGLRVVLVLTKLDRLIVELRLPPADAYHKLRHTVAHVNALLREAALTAPAPAGGGARPPAPQVDPRDGSVLFSAAVYGVCFSLESFGALYAAQHSLVLDEAAFARRLWGDAWRLPSGVFVGKAPKAGAPRTFVELVLAPLYKLAALALSAPDADSLRAGLHAAGVGGQVDELALAYDPKPLLRAVLSAFVGPPTAFADACARHLPSPEAAAPAKVAAVYTGDQATAAGAGMLACDPAGPLVACVAKLVHEQTCERFDCLVRVLSGTLTPGMAVRVLGEGYCAEDEEDSAQRTVGELFLLQGRYRLPITSAPAGSWCLASGLDGSVLKSATIVDAHAAAPDIAICRPLRVAARSVLKVAIEPLRPSELPKMIDGVRKLCK